MDALAEIRNRVWHPQVHMPLPTLRRHALWGLLGLVLWSALACSGDTTDPSSLPPAKTYWALRLDWHAVNLALGALAPGQPVVDTAHLTATAYNELGTPLTSTSTIHYHTKDSSVVVDSLTGLVTAKYVTLAGPTAVVASLTVGNVTLTDTAKIQVTPLPLAAPLAAFSIQPKPDGLDSAKVAVDGFNVENPVLVVYATIAPGSPSDTVCRVGGCSPSFLIDYSTSDSSIAYVDQSGLISTQLPGHVTFYARTLAYGVPRVDSLPFVIGWPIVTGTINVIEKGTTGSTQLTRAFNTTSLTVGVGGWVDFISFDTARVDIVFDSTQSSQISFSPNQGDGSNYLNAYTAEIYGNGVNGLQDLLVIFADTGRYQFHSKALGTTGVITVRP